MFAPASELGDTTPPAASTQTAPPEKARGQTADAGGGPRRFSDTQRRPLHP